MITIDEPNRARTTSEIDEIRFETQKEIAEFQKTRQEHLVFQVKKKKYVLVASFKSLKEARGYLKNINEAKAVNDKSRCLLWVCIDLVDWDDPWLE